MSWINGWTSRDSDHPAFRSAVPSAAAWRKIKDEIQEAVSDGVLDTDIISACKDAGELQLDVLTDIPGWDH
jgi:hypothetical protein